MDFEELLSSLNFWNYRNFLIRIEDEMINFLQEIQKKQEKGGNFLSFKLKFPAMTNYYRYLIHATAQVFFTIH